MQNSPTITREKVAEEPLVSHGKDARTFVALFDLAVIIAFLVGGAVYYRDPHFWSVGFIGDNQWGDAEFWLNGAIHFARGIWEDNPGRGFRPGYFVFSGCVLAVLGNSFLSLYSVLLVSFLTAASAFYLSLSRVVGRVVALISVTLAIFNPYTAEWVATTTTDATGLMLHMLALSLLLASYLRGFRLWTLCGFGVVFSLAELTRPLMSPFLLVAILAVLLSSQLSIKRRFAVLVSLLVAFAIPTLTWTVFQKLTVGEFSVSQNEASAFYAASDPKIQCWNPDMYHDVGASAQKRLGKLAISDAELNDEFRRLSLENYLNPTNWKYHKRRFLANFWTVANVNFKQCQHPDFDIQAQLLSLLLWGAMVERLFARKAFGVLAAAALIATQLLTWGHYGAFVIVSLCVSLSDVCFKRKNGSICLLATYWLTGLLSLYLVGGTWGDPKNLEAFYVNSLGYRLGMQFFFVSAILTAWIALRLVYGTEVTSAISGSVRRFTKPSANAQYVVVSMFTAVLASVVAIELCGATIIGKRYWEREHEARVSYPATSGISELKPVAKPTLPESHKIDRDQVDVLVTGALSSFIWNMPGQKRCLAFLYGQKDVRPFEMNPNRIIVEFPQYLDSSTWTDRQGLWLLRRTAEIKSLSYEPYYWSGVSVRKFVPLAKDGSKFVESEAISFPLSKYASQLAATGELNFDKLRAEWSPDSGLHPRMRRIILKETASDQKDTIEITLSNALGKRTLDLALEVPFSYTAPLMRVSLYRASGASTSKFISIVGKPMELFKQTLDVSDPRIAKVTLDFEYVPKNGMSLYELNLTADDFRISDPASHK